MVLIASMVILGGATRLTESGLSIVEWKLVSGTLPPLNEAEWAAEFAEYKATPQFQKVNAHFSLPDFKKIFWLEYLHRLLGRVIGLTIVIPFLYFAARRMLTPHLFWRGVFLCFFVAAQGTIGWIMVASGLVNEPRVAPIKLGLHLLLAFGLFCAIQWTRWQVLDMRRGDNNARTAFTWGVRAVLLVIVVQIYLGALVAGLRAGLSYNTYPLMDGKFVPDGLYLLSPWWLNHLESVLTVQFQHRMGAIVLVAAVLALIMRGWKYVELRHCLRIVAIAIGLQFVLGVATLLSGVNLWLAVAHQFLALGVLAHFLKLAYLCPLDVNQHASK